MIKGAIFFLLVMVAIGMIGNAIAPSAMRRIIRRQLPKASTCPRCGRYLVGKGGCDCKKRA
ncbi:hypothetical protein [Paragemmobacter straminiformis]|uniref:Uncharacterized protein n=1 Tax=Paragemmobacter straminiformis TaxID=2045119 RepID=A0A842IAF5_9RHOB|nr:hypothetical protein [Gemmobacter straminiformis]MBC2835968.1 hypothetical protein [Gemmobacter straminiformis]